MTLSFSITTLASDNSAKFGPNPIRTGYVTFKVEMASSILI